VASNYRQFFTGSTTQTIVLPVTSTLVTGIAYEIENNSTGLLTVNSSGGNLVGTIPSGVCAHAVCIGTTLTTAADWDWDYISTTTITGTGANVLGTSPTITTPTISSLSSAAATALTLQSAGTTAITVDTSQNTTFAGIQKSSVTSGNFALADQGGSNTLFQQIQNSGNTLKIGVENSSGGGIFTGSGSFDSVIGTSSNRNLCFGVFGATKMMLDNAGNLLVGVTSASGNEKFNVTTSSDKVAFFKQSADTNAYVGIHVQIGSAQNNTSSYHFRGETRSINNWYLYGNGTTSYSSDIRLKKNVQTARGYLEDLNKLRVVKYQWKGEDPDCQQVELGLIAQEVEEVFPNLIQEHEVEGVGDIKNIKQSVLPFMMLKAIQELKAINDTQAETINALTARIVALENA
jgi:dihydroxyacetone kinase DhaKLM complex PTS-EIIA-like component DhaM